MTIQSGIRMRPIAAMNSDTVVVANTKYASARVGTKRETTVAVATYNSVRSLYLQAWRGERSEGAGT